VARACHDEEMRDIEIEGDMGADARQLLHASAVTVNGEPEARRGRQLHRGDVVAVGSQAIRVA
jgi:ribosome-associated protein